uniref:Uncharacterized protein LOC117350242 isoform X3 n=1 Tax=Geotrypetes seraphini TaxID=260995 RepID=A0A6P8P951_GEOSA|nr:uncharacterized protein LOC117350242 isoform X3 [Geotrypetes seraphini]
MERMEVDQCACAAPGGGGGGGALLRRSNSAPMITHLSDSSLLFQSCGNRCRRSSVSVNLSCPGLSFPLSPVQMSAIHMESPVIFQEVQKWIHHPRNCSLLEFPDLGIETSQLSAHQFPPAALGLAVWEEFLMEILQCLSKHHASSLHPFSPLKLRMTHVTATFSAFETLVTHGRIIQKI